MEDFLLLDQLLTDEELMIRDSIRKYVQTSVMPKISHAYESAQFPKETIKELADLGLFGMTLPSEYGGSGIGHVAYGLVCQELEYGDSALRSVVSVQGSLAMYAIYSFGTDAQKQKWLQQMAAGKVVGCFGLTEPNSGSDPASMRTTAKKVSNGWEITGSKTWITNATIAEVAIVWAKTDIGIQAFLVEKDFPGFNASEIKQKMSLRASITGELILDKCVVPEENRLPGSEKGLIAALECLTQARYGIAWGATGAAMACYDIALQYTKDRKQFAKPLANFQLVQYDLVDMCTEITKTQSFNLQLGRLLENNDATFAMVSMGKMNAAKIALNIARSARNLLGANGVSLEYHVIRHLLNLESVFTYEGTDNIHHLIVGKELTEMNAFE